MNSRRYSKFLAGFGTSFVLLVIVGTSAMAAAGDTTLVSTALDRTLHIDFQTGTMSESAPIARQNIQGKQVPVDISSLLNGQELSFTLGGYNPRDNLYIDPSFNWNTFPGSQQDEGYSIAIDGNGYIYIIGHSYSTWGTPVNPFAS